MAAPENRFPGGNFLSLYADLTGCAVAVLLSAWAYLTLPGRDPLRLLLTAPTLLFVPGYLFVEAFRPSRQSFKNRLVSAGVAPGATIALVAILALLTAFLPGGFRADSIVTIVTLACIGLIAAATYHRTRILILSRTRPAPPRNVNMAPPRSPDLPRPNPNLGSRPPSPPATRPQSVPNGLPRTTLGANQAPVAAQRPKPRSSQTGRF